MAFVSLFVCLFVYADASASTQKSSDKAKSSVSTPGSHVQSGLAQIESAMLAEVLDFYSKKDINNLRRVVNLMVKVFPESPYADDGLYWLARLASEQGRDEESLFALENLFRHYPAGNKVQPALVLKAVVYGKMGKWDQAEQAVFNALDSRKKSVK